MPTDFGSFIRPTAPGSPVPGYSYWFDARTAPGILNGWTGSQWVSMAASFSFTPPTGLTVRADSIPLIASSVTTIRVNNLTINGSGDVFIPNTGSSVFASSFNLIVREEDGNPTANSVSTIRFPNGSLTVNGSGDVSVAMTGSGAAAGFNLTVREVDSGPTVSSVNLIIVSNGSLTDNGSGSVTIQTGTSSGGGGGGLTLIEHQTLTGGQTDWTWNTGIDGNTDGVYRFVVKIISNATAPTYYIQPNNITTSAIGYLTYNGGGAGTLGGVNQLPFGFNGNSGDPCGSEITIEARKNPDSVNADFMYSGTGFTKGSVGINYIMWFGGRHANFTNLTSIVLHSDVASGFGKGSEGFLYKYQQ